MNKGELITVGDEMWGGMFNLNRSHRVVLWKISDPEKAKIMFIGLNPSTANELKLDPTLTRIERFAKDWGYGGFYMFNLFTYVSPYPEDLLEYSIEYNVHTEADGIMEEIKSKCHKTVFCWGCFSMLKKCKERIEKIERMFPNAQCFGKTKAGYPKHPLFLSAETGLKVY